MIDYIKVNMWVIYIVTAIISTGLVHMVLARISRHLTKKAEQSKMLFAEAFLKAFTLPMGFLIWFLGLSFTSSIFLAYKKNSFLIANLSVIKQIGIVSILCWVFVRFIRCLEDLYLALCEQQAKEVDKTLVHALRQLLTIAVVIIGLLLVMQAMNIPVAGLLAFGGIGGAGVALAAKDLLANFFGGLVVYLDRPFKVGDWIRSPDKNIEGIVEYIGWRMTRIRTFDKRPLYVPNGVFLTISVENPSRMLHRRIKTNIGVRYQDADKINKITQEIKDSLLDHKEIDTSQAVTVSLVEFGPSSLNIMVSAYCKTIKATQFYDVQHEILMKILDIIAGSGAECAFPTQTLYVQPAI
ncbi:mechanosensitive ion channel family protein [Legionella parisiensis]|uniref:Low conductance mechanosensitive channel YnaI n=1 Tax=Legionella parisiensis TaxID=45071 RepID=A0A1E5JPU6_9GAMM|nr:mechanosensitive ion channel family protein [Legionella parisiensis]KTD44401.1 small-conductance mechanosensitive channel [Legionella parisiensis]OEH46545.1 Low conductance mechanosensitive channel YnaI [Legionella parisiensis]STX72028.1 small-conductance mechanosensitive channel [Legionella parisiensis]